jgi:hypothetical protein
MQTASDTVWFSARNFFGELLIFNIGNASQDIMATTTEISELQDGLGAYTAMGLEKCLEALNTWSSKFSETTKAPEKVSTVQTYYETSILEIIEDVGIGSVYTACDGN